MPGLGLSIPQVAQRRRLLAPIALPVGFYMNGSTNPALKAGISRVKAGTGRMKALMIGDSTTVGEGGGTTADSNRLTNARPNRVAAVLASLFTQAGVPATDNSMYGDGCIFGAGLGQFYPQYDPRATRTGTARTTSGRDFAGGGILSIDGAGGSFGYQVADVNTFEIVAYNAGGVSITLTIDGAAPTTGPASIAPTGANSGFTRAIVSVATSGNRAFVAASAGTNIRSIRGYNSLVPAIDFLVHAGEGWTTADASASGSSFKSLDSIGFDAPDVTTINLGLNPINQGVSVSTFTSQLQLIITKAKLSGDVLLIFPTPAGGNYNNNVAAYNDAAKSLAASNGIAFFSLWEYYGPFTSTFGARLYDGVVHPLAPLYAEIAQLVYQCIMAMAA